MWMAHAAGHQSWTFSGTTAIIWLAKPVRLLAVWRQRARTRQDLLRLNDHYLRDIGLTRHQIMMEFAKPFWRA
jgi:uncharacterized protein YjiS (DUF1127 family)